MLRPLPLLPLLLGAVAACGSGERPHHSVLLITLDTTRADALSAMGAPAGLTPHLDALAAEGVLYERAHTVAPLTLPAHASMLTGLYPPRHGVRTNGTTALPASARTLAEWASDTGTQTAAFLGSLVLSPAFGLDQGFDVYDAPRPEIRQRTTFYAERPGREVVDAAIAWLAARDRRRTFFLWVHLWDPHGPYEPPQEFLRRAPESPYLGEVAAADDAVGRLVAAMKADGAWDDTVVVVAGDHGEAFGEHGEFSHSSYCYEPTLRVPLIVRQLGGRRAGERSQETVSVVDVFSTLADALGFHVNLMDVDGTSLLAGPVKPDRGVYFESYYGYLSYGWSPLAGWLDSRGKYLFSSEPQFFDPATDPGEEHDRIDEEGLDLERYRDGIAGVAARKALEPDENGIDSATRQGIADLGYAALGPGGDLPDPLAETGLPSPASRVGEQMRILRAQEQFNAGHYAEAERIHMEILEENPDNLYSLERLGICRVRQRRHREAIDPLERVMASGRGSADAIVNLAVCLRASGRTERAIECCRRALEIDGENVWAMRLLVDLLRREGKEEEAAPWVERFEDLTGAPFPAKDREEEQ